MKELLNFIFPVACLGCSRQGNYLCDDCLTAINFAPQQRCAVCNRSSITGATHSRCQGHWMIDGVWAIAKYDGVMRQLLHKFKYGYATELAEILVNLLLSHSLALFQKFNLLIPIPLFPLRARWRGFNQAENLAQLLAQKWHLHLNNHLLERVQPSPPQAQIRERHQRLKNIHHDFQVSPNVNQDLIKNKSILLIDDIVTTSTTLRQAALPLKRAGAKRVWGLVMAR